ncbi:DUF4389 domain-containing protein [Nocardioides sp. 31GB23]|uniref:DUF4389 domain-containing protein n=1 Tax=Nocardioides sp. 31GB23 TaxID=3156065 RepID=UPI0032AEDEA4
MTDPPDARDAPPPVSTSPTRTSRPVPLVIGVLLALVGLPLLLAGAGLGWALATQRDDDGFFSTTTEQISTETVALTSPVLDLGAAGPDGRWTERDIVTLRLRATSGGSPVFVGIGPSEEVERYLAAASYDEIGDLVTDPFDYTLTRRGSGGSLPTPPSEQDFWSDRSIGSGTQTLTWDVRPGNWTAVVMNGDGSPGLSTGLSAGGRVDMLAPLAWVLGALGLLLILGGALLVVHGAHAPSAADQQRPDPVPAPTSGVIAGADQAVPSPVTISGHQDQDLSRWLWLVKWLLAIPHFIVLALLWPALVVLTVVAFFAILVTGRYPRGLFDFNVGVLRWTWRVQFYCTNAIGTDRYPPFTLDHADYPADLDVAHPERLSRGLVLVKWWLLAIPHLVVLAVLAGTWTLDDDLQPIVGGLIGALTLAAGLLLLFTGSYPAPLFDLLVGLNRWVYRVVAYVALMTDTYPPFRLDQGPVDPSPARPPEPPQPGAEGERAQQRRQSV